MILVLVWEYYFSVGFFNGGIGDRFVIVGHIFSPSVVDCPLFQVCAQHLCMSGGVARLRWVQVWGTDNIPTRGPRQMLRGLICCDHFRGRRGVHRAS